VGAFLSPLISQTLRARGYTWREFFWISLGLAIFNVSFSLFAFQTTREEFQIEKQLALASQALCDAMNKNKSDLETETPCSSKSPVNGIPMSRILAMPYVWTIALFLGVYQGAETIAQGFIVTFLLHERVSDASFCGLYIPDRPYSLARTPIQTQSDLLPVVSTSIVQESRLNFQQGFWAGLALGRVVWGILSPR
jgi:cyanate permease